MAKKETGALIHHYTFVSKSQWWKFDQTLSLRESLACKTITVILTHTHTLAHSLHLAFLEAVKLSDVTILHQHLHFIASCSSQPLHSFDGFLLNVHDFICLRGLQVYTICLDL